MPAITDPETARTTRRVAAREPFHPEPAADNEFWSNKRVAVPTLREVKRSPAQKVLFFVLRIVIIAIGAGIVVALARI